MAKLEEHRFYHLTINLFCKAFNNDSKKGWQQYRKMLVPLRRRPSLTFLEQFLTISNKKHIDNI